MKYTGSETGRRRHRRFRADSPRADARRRNSRLRDRQARAQTAQSKIRDAATLAVELGVARAWVYDHAEELGVAAGRRAPGSPRSTSTPLAPCTADLQTNCPLRHMPLQTHGGDESKVAVLERLAAAGDVCDRQASRSWGARAGAKMTRHADGSILARTGTGVRCATRCASPTTANAGAPVLGPVEPVQRPTGRSGTSLPISSAASGVRLPCGTPRSPSRCLVPPIRRPDDGSRRRS